MRRRWEAASWRWWCRSWGRSPRVPRLWERSSPTWSLEAPGPTRSGHAPVRWSGRRSSKMPSATPRSTTRSLMQPGDRDEAEPRQRLVLERRRQHVVDEGLRRRRGRAFRIQVLVGKEPIVAVLDVLGAGRDAFVGKDLQAIAA